MKTLILTEKPSVGRDFARALAINGKREGYLESDSHIITWGIGHLLEPCEPGDYDPKWSTWDVTTLPILPDTFQYRPLPKTRKQLKIVYDLLRRKDVSDVIIATDAGREGEVIARTILAHAKTPKRVTLRRFWTSQALTPDVVRTALAHLRPAAEYDRLWYAGQARQIADWLIGMNGTRAATLQLGELYSIGRVQTAVLGLIVDRRRAREAFHPESYYTVRTNFENARGSWQGTWFHDDQDRFTSASDADAVVAAVTGQTGVVSQVKRSQKTQPPPLLYSLTELQRAANTRYKLSAKKTLDIAQEIYESMKCLSYPRTDARVLGSQNVEMVKTLLQTLRGSYPGIFAGVQADRITIKNTRVFDDARLTDHHALIPLAPLPDRATPEQKKIYDLVLRRFAAAFHDNYQYEDKQIVTDVAGETFRTEGRYNINMGWQELYPDADSARAIPVPPLVVGEPATVRASLREDKKTTPPPDYTDAGLLRDMSHPAKYVQSAELQRIFKGDVGLGTQATRAQTIELLLQRLYVTRERKTCLVATDKGCLLIDSLRRLPQTQRLTQPQETAQWERELARVAEGAASADGIISRVRTFAAEMVREVGTLPAPRDPASLGACPACQVGQIVEGQKGYGCTRWRKEHGGCRFTVWKSIAKRAMSRDEVATLLAKKEIGPLDGFTARSGKSFAARLVLDETGAHFDFLRKSKSTTTARKAGAWRWQR